LEQLQPSSKTLTSALALHVYRAPQRQWSMALFGSTAMLSKAELSQKLFAEGASFRQIVHIQRLMRIFSDLGQIDHVDDEVAKNYGFLHRRQLACSLCEHFGIELTDLQSALGCTTASLSSDTDFWPGFSSM
jgi:hypothetical protein